MISNSHVLILQQINRCFLVAWLWAKVPCCRLAQISGRKTATMLAISRLLGASSRHPIWRRTAPTDNRNRQLSFFMVFMVFQMFCNNFSYVFLPSPGFSSDSAVEAPIALPPWRRPTRPATWPATNLHQWSPQKRRPLETTIGEVTLAVG